MDLIKDQTRLETHVDAKSGKVIATNSLEADDGGNDEGEEEEEGGEDAEGEEEE